MLRVDDVDDVLVAHAADEVLLEVEEGHDAALAAVVAQRLHNVAVDVDGQVVDRITLK